MKQNAMEMVIKVKDTREIERLVAILNLGLCVAIEQGVFLIATAEDYLYSPYTLEILESLGISSEMRRVVHLGTELEDVVSLLPETLPESLAEMKQASLEILQALATPASEQPSVQIVAITPSFHPATNGKASANSPTKVLVGTDS